MFYVAEAWHGAGSRQALRGGYHDLNMKIDYHKDFKIYKNG